MSVGDVVIDAGRQTRWTNTKFKVVATYSDNNTGLELKPDTVAVCKLDNPSYILLMNKKFLVIQ